MYARVQICAVLLLAITATPRASRAELCGDIPNTLIVLDRSASMSNMAGSQSRWSAAVAAVNDLGATFAGTLDLGLMLFPGTGWYCEAGSLTVPCAANTGAAIASAMQSSYPQGNTPIADTLNNAFSYLQGLGSARPRYVVLVTDGEETCSGDPAAAATTLHAAGIDTYVVGFGSGVDPLALDALAVAGGTSGHYQADNPTQLTATLQQIAGQLSCCGNGTLDGGELCDITIAAGQPGACPSQCDDGDACTTDALAGSACDVSCSFTPITTPAHGDGCCPAGATSVTDSDCPPACGDGVLDPNETCDTAIAAGPGACPGVCDDSNTCTVDSLTGSGCAAVCTFSAISQPANGDGCCPPGAHSGNDDDCPVECGNGVVDPGEKCDVAITSGAGACPTSCDDGDACTEDVLHVQHCATGCQHAPITAPIDADGCCPPGTNSNHDSDCKPVCGNGEVEQGEKCDSKIAAGALGSCPVSCDDGDACTVDVRVGSGCQAVCAVSKKIGPMALITDGCCPAGHSSLTDPDCPDPCGPDRKQGCVDLCAEVSCPDGEFCERGRCKAWPDASGTPGAAPDEGKDGPAAPSGQDDPAAGQGEPLSGNLAVGTGGGGCDCSTSGSPDGLPWLLLVAGVWLARRRRNSGRQERLGAGR